MKEQIIANRYQLLEQKSRDKVSTVYESLDQAENVPVTVKLFHEEVQQRSLERLLRFRREIENVSKAAHPNLLKVLASGEFEGRDYLVTEHVNGARPLSQDVQQASEGDKAADIILQACEGLAAAHEKGVVHQALNPSSILLFQNGADPTAKLTDFGIGLLLDLAGIKEEDEVIRTFGYMSPESTGILRKPIDERSDIYSLGIIFYQLVTGRLPYEGKDTSTLIHQHIAQKPALPTELNPSVPPVIERIILRLIGKDPLDRYQSVSGLILDLEQYRRQRAEGKEVPDFEIGRSDRAGELDYTTRLIGRDKELDVLKNAVSQSKEAKGSLSLVYGDPGVGKTRLIDELRGHVHSVGGIFVGGRGHQHEIATPFKVFSEAVEAYVDKVKRLSAEERQATVKRMKEACGELGGEVVKMTPAIVDLIGEPPELEELDPAKERIRFLMTMTNFLLSLGTPESPLAIFMDDLQWVDEGSIELLERVAVAVSTHPITLIASFRDKEVAKDHLLLKTIDKLKEKNVPLHDILVKPFAMEDTNRIVSEVLLEEEESVLPLAKELHQRTKGNVFFVLELLRSLVDQKIVYFEDNHYRFDAGKLKAAALPTDIVEVVIGRIEEIPEENQKILSYASVLGQDINLEFLSDLTNIPDERVLDALEEGIENQFLVRDITGKENISFVHDRIRETFYERIADNERISLHEQVGHLLEEQHKEDLEPVLFDLAHHFAQARIEDKTLLYSRQAGRKAEGAFAYDQAVRLYEVAKGILEKQGKTSTTEYIDTLESLGTACYQAGKYDEALQTLRKCESLIPKGEKLRKAQVLSKTGDVLQKMGELDECERVLEQALRVLGVRLPNNIVTVLLGSLRQFIAHGLHSVLPVLFVRKKYSNDPKVEVVSHLLFRLFYLYYFTDLIKGIYVLFRAQNIAEKKLGPSRKLCQIYALTGMAWMQVGWGWWARRHSLLAERIAENLNDKAHIGLAHAFHAWVEHPYRPPESVQLGSKAVELLKGAGEYWDLGHAGCCYLWGKQKLGKNLNELIEENKGQIAIMQSINAPQNLGWALGVEGLFLTFIGDHRLEKEAIERLEEAIRLLEQVNDKPWVICAVGYLAYAHLRLGNYEEAIRHADRVARRFILDHNLTTWLLDIVGMCTHVYLYVAMNKPDLTKAEKRKYLRKAKYFCLLARFKGWMYPTYRGWAYLAKGTYKWVKGKKRKAIRTWDKGIAYLRENTQDTYRLACILLEEASFLLQDNPDDEKANEYLVEAKEIFTQLGATFDLQRVDELLGTEDAVTEAVESRQVLTMSRQLESLLNVTRAIGSVFDLEVLLDRVIDQAMKVTGAERGFLLLYDEADNTLKVNVLRGVKTEFAGQSFSYETHSVSLEMVQQVERSGEGVVEGHDGTAFPKIAADLKEYDVKEALCVPLKAKDKPLGMIYLDNRMAGGIFGKDELELMSSFAVQASVSIENATLHQKAVAQERMEQDLEVAGQIQRLFLPKTVQVIEGVSIDALYSPAEFIGGDYYDVIKIDDTRYGIIIMDISGHGSSAAIVMSVISFLVHSSAQSAKDTAELMTELNTNLYERLEGEKYATGIFMVYDKEKESLEYTNAGHSAILLYKKNKDELVELSEAGMPVGIMQDSKYEKGEFKFEQEDLILLQTDGVFETRNNKGEMFSLEGVKQLLLDLKDQEVTEINKSIISAAKRFQGGGPQQDDITLIAIKKSH